MCASAQYLSKCTEYLSTAVYLNVFCVYVTWTCACIKTKLSPDGSHGAQCLSAAQVPLSVSARQLCLTSISKHKQSCQSQKHCSSVFKSVIIVATRNKILTVYLWLIVLPDHTSAKKLKKKKKKKPTRTVRTGFWLWHLICSFSQCFFFQIRMFFYTLWMQRVQVKMKSNVCQQHCLAHTEAAVRRCSLLVHPCCLLTSSSLVRNKRVTRCFPSPFSGPWTTPTHTPDCVCVFVWVNGQNSMHHRMCYNRTVCLLQLRCFCQTFVL